MTPSDTGTLVGQTTTLTRYVAQIPANVVTTKGVDYYLRASDGSTTAYSPGTVYSATPYTQVDGTQVHYFTIHVAEPIRYVHTPVYEAPAHDPIHITTQANCSTGTCTCRPRGPTRVVACSASQLRIWPAARSCAAS